MSDDLLTGLNGPITPDLIGETASLLGNVASLPSPGAGDLAEAGHVELAVRP